MRQQGSPEQTIAFFVPSARAVQAGALPTLFLPETRPIAGVRRWNLAGFFRHRNNLRGENESIFSIFFPL
jgi:hypothetical protein